MASTTQALYDTTHYGDILRGMVVQNNRDVLLSKNVALAAAGAAIATTTTKAKTVNSVTYLTDGIFRTALAGTDNFWDFTVGTGLNQALGTATMTVVPAGSVCLFLLCVATGGTQYVYQSSIQVSGSGSLCTFQYCPDGQAPFSVLSITTDATHTFTPATTALNATGVTAAFTDGPGNNLIPVLGAANGSGLTVQYAMAGPNSYLG